MLTTILFDLDGTLIDTNELIIDSFNNTFKLMGKPVPQRNEIIYCFGEPLNRTMSKFFDDVDKAIEIYREFNFKHHDNRISLYENTEKLLKSLKEDNFKLGIVTSKNKVPALRGLEILNIFEYFDVIIAGDDVKKHKPDPEPVVKACEFLGVSPTEAMMVGDTIYDIMSGREAGSKTCGVLYSFMKDKLLECDSDYYIENLIEILEILKKENN